MHFFIIAEAVMAKWRSFPRNLMAASLISVWHIPRVWLIPVFEIEKNAEDVYNYTAKGNLVAVISNGTAVLGLVILVQWRENPLWKARAFFLKFLPILNVFDIEVNEKDPKKLIEFCRQIAPNFGA